jgi:hypothetical protein
MASETDIANRALSRLGEARITLLGTDITKRAKSVDDAYLIVRDEVIRGYPWNCLMKRGELKAGVITAATLANPVVLTVEAHGLAVGDEVTVEDMAGMTEPNDLHFILSAVTADTMTLTNAHGANVSQSCTTAIGSKNLVVTDSTALKIGEVIAGAGIATGTKVAAISAPLAIQMDTDATATGTSSRTFGGYTAYTSGGTVKLKPYPFGYDQRFRLPADCMRVVEVFDSRLPWVVEGNDILSDESSTIQYRYIGHAAARAATDPVTNNYDALLISALAARLAMEVCEELTQSNSKFERARQAYGSAMVMARGADAQEQSPQDFQEDDWILSRQGSNFGVRNPGTIRY